MKNLALLFLPLLFFSPNAQQTPSAKQNIVLSHVTVIDATGAPAHLDVTVVITGDRITEIGDSEKIRVPKDAQVVNATGKFLIPGLWDMHVHWYEKDYLPLFIANGVTGIRIMWGSSTHHEWRKEIGLVSTNCGWAAVRGVGQVCDIEQPPWLCRYESRKIVWLPLGFCCSIPPRRQKKSHLWLETNSR
jgi:hypothetical protein